MKLLRSHGITKDKGDFLNKKEGDWYREQQDLGFNYRLTDLQAALGLSQIKRTLDFVSKRREIAKRYDELLSNLPLLRLNKNHILFIMASICNKNKK